jgi:hypothetical protein
MDAAMLVPMAHEMNVVIGRIDKKKKKLVFIFMVCPLERAAAECN